MKTFTSFSHEFRYRHMDGQYCWHLGRVIPVMNDADEVISWTGTFTDIHKQRVFTAQLENKVAERTRELEQTIAQLDQFAFVASHDLQEPLRKIITFASQIRSQYSDNLPKAGKEYVQKIGLASGRMTTLIKELLNYSRLIHHEKFFVSVDLNVVINNILEDLELLIEQKGAEIIKGELPSLDGMPIQLNQLFYNLVNNSLKFSTTERTPVISIQSRVIEESELTEHPELNSELSFFEIVVKDNGIGFEPRFRDQIFVIFQRLNDKSLYEGTGIGLALCKKIVENHKGKIFAVGNEEDGAAFHMILPQRQF